MPRPVTVTYRVLATPAATARAAAQFFLDAAVKAATARGLARIAISGGSTPKSMFGLLADPAEPFLNRCRGTRSTCIGSTSVACRRQHRVELPHDQ